MNWVKEEISSILKELNTSSTGLTTKEAENRIQIYGKNALEEKEKESEIKKFLMQFTEPLTVLLIIAGVISLLINDIIDAGVIFFVLPVVLYNSHMSARDLL